MADKRGAKVKGQSSNRRTTTRSTSKDGSTNAVNNQVFYCGICEEVINEPNDPDGDDSIFCNGVCNGWIHRRCAGLSTARFKEIAKADDPFFCPNCHAEVQRKEIETLKSVLTNLQSELGALKIALNQKTSNVIQPTSIGDTSDDSAPAPSPTAVPSPDTADPDKKFGVVIYGISESPNGTPKSQRISADFEAVAGALNPLSNDLTEQSIRDCIRLGKYAPNSTRPRPILAKLNSSRHISSIMANRSKLSSTNLSIKPHMSPLEREIESLLLKERRKLIDNKTPAKHIQIRKNQLLVSGNIHAKVSIVNRRCSLTYIHGKVINGSHATSHTDTQPSSPQPQASPSNRTPRNSPQQSRSQILTSPNPQNGTFIRSNLPAPNSDSARDNPYSLPATSTQEINPPTQSQ